MEGLGGLEGEPRGALGGWARAPEGGRSLKGGGGGCSLPGGRRGPLLSEGGGGRVSPGVGPCRFMAARHGTIPPTLRAGVPFFGGAEGGGGGGWRLWSVPSHAGGGGVAGGSSVRLGRVYPVASPGLVGPFEEEPRIRRGGLRYMVWHGMVWYGMVWYGMVWYGMVWYGMVWYGMVWYGIFPSKPSTKTLCQPLNLKNRFLRALQSVDGQAGRTGRDCVHGVIVWILRNVVAHHLGSIAAAPCSPREFTVIAARGIK